MIYLETLPVGSKAPLKLWTDGPREELDGWLCRTRAIPVSLEWQPAAPLPHYLLPVRFRRRARIAGAIDAQPVLFLQCQRNCSKCGVVEDKP